MKLRIANKIVRRVMQRRHLVAKDPRLECILPRDRLSTEDRAITRFCKRIQADRRMPLDLSPVAEEDRMTDEEIEQVMAYVLDADKRRKAEHV